MDKDKVDSIGKQVTGSLKEAIGKVTGDAKIQDEGRAEKREAEQRGGAERPARGGTRDR